MNICIICRCSNQFLLILPSTNGFLLYENREIEKRALTSSSEISTLAPSINLNKDKELILIVIYTMEQIKYLSVLTHYTQDMMIVIA